MATWPKTFPPLTPEQERISDDFVKHWHEVLPKKFGVIDRFNHSYPVRTAPAGFHRTLEIGAGIGEHLEYEKLTPAQEAGYHALELRENMSAAIRARFPRIQTVTGDCQQRLPHPDGHFDRIVAIHVLEHLPNLPAAAREMYRLCDKARGVFSIVIPCEGSAAYSLARRMSAQRIFEKRYKQSYKWFIEREHVNRPHEILAELDPYFVVTDRRFYPFRFVPATWCNLVIGLTLVPRERPLGAVPLAA
ncbi:MAG TPA: class I SAM-dependent methyltransferase [Gemmata sp.]